MEKQIRIVTIHNFSFMGVMRESDAKLDGHITFIYSDDEFCIKDNFDYGGLTWLGTTLDTPELNDADIRLVNDAILNHKIRYSRIADKTEIEFFNDSKKYPLKNTHQSYNVKYGDTVTHLETDEIIQVDGGYDVGVINRNFFYKITNRNVIHPAKVTLETFKNKLSEIDPFKLGQFGGWVIATEIPKKIMNSIAGWITVNGAKYRWYHNNDDYYIVTPDGIIYYKQSSISAPFYDCLDIIMGLVHNEYRFVEGKRFYHCIHECTCSIDTMGLPQFRFKLFTENESYHYNNRLTHF